ncbi:hypothetical protein BH09PSE4_BH09PSE4_13070 [soil metagenome]
MTKDAGNSPISTTYVEIACPLPVNSGNRVFLQAKYGDQLTQVKTIARSRLPRSRATVTERPGAANSAETASAWV